MPPMFIESAMRQSLATSQTGRFALYTAVHKGLRRALANTLLSVGQADASDPRSVADAMSSVRALVNLCRGHLHSENQYIHPAMEARRPGSASATADEHLSHEQSFETLSADLLAVERSTGREREAALTVLYHRLAFFVAANYEHMFEEETDNQAVLWDAYSDAELRAIHGAIVASHSPEETSEMLRTMLPALAPAERAAFLAGARRAMPAEAFNGLVAFTLSLLDEVNAAKLRAAVGVNDRELAVA
jgi:hypothetical protein